jgi:hypothetical protein
MSNPDDRRNEDSSKNPQKSSPDASIYPGTGPTSIEGVEASDLPDGGRGPVEQDPHHEHSRKLPEQIGGEIGNATDVGLHATPDAAEARDYGNRKRN